MDWLSEQSIEIIKDEFDRKAMILENVGEPIDPFSLYEEIFDDIENMVLPFVMIDGEDSEKLNTHPKKKSAEKTRRIQKKKKDDAPQEKKHIAKLSVADALTLAENRADILIGSCTYINSYISEKTAKDCYGFIIDLDNVTSDFLLRLFQNGWTDKKGYNIPIPNVIVNSGTGLHLYFIFDEPIPCFNRTKPDLKKLYRRLAYIETYHEGETKRQSQWFGQCFRIAGGRNKYGLINAAYEIRSERYDIDDLARSVGIDVHFERYGEPRKRPAEKYTFNDSSSSGNRAGYAPVQFYEKLLKKSYDKAQKKHRYTTLMALTVVAYKCSVSYDTLSADLKALVEHLNRKSMGDIVRTSEIAKALKMYNPKALGTTAVTLEGWLGYSFKHVHHHKGIDRFPRKKTEEMRQRGELTNFEVYAASARDKKYPDGSWRGRGRAAKKDVVLEWRRLNPNGKKADCIRQTGLSKATVYKWWSYKTI